MQMQMLLQCNVCIYIYIFKKTTWYATRWGSQTVAKLVHECRLSVGYLWFVVGTAVGIYGFLVVQTNIFQFFSQLYNPVKKRGGFNHQQQGHIRITVNQQRRILNIE